MCGIAGFLGVDLSPDDAQAKLKTMGHSLRRRGPDDEGLFFDAAAGIGFVHRRLSIIDLSPTGHQPMSSPDGRYVITFNGEIYNFESLRRTLAAEGSRFVGTSDTEVLLHAIASWGIKTALTRAVGMFALAVWDRVDHVLYLARDRLGEKPLCVARLKRGLAFASDFSALRRAALVDPGIDPRSLGLYLKYAFVPAPFGIHVDSSKVLPGSIVAVTRAKAPPPLGGPWTQDTVHGDLNCYSTKYWDADPLATAAATSTMSHSADAIQEEFEGLLEESVSLQRHADVPVGAFLSGGIDSSLVCSVAQSLASSPIRTFTMGFDNPLFDESKYSAAVAAHLGTAHTCVMVSAADVLKHVPTLAELADEPFADPSQLPTFLVSQIASREVKVCLTGDGGDELFGGYNRYIEPMRMQRHVAKLPRAVAKLAAAGVRTVPAGFVDTLFERLSRHSSAKQIRVQNPGRKLHRIADVLTAPTPQALYETLMSQWNQPSDVMRGAAGMKLPSIERAARDWSWASFADRAMLWDLEHYLPDNNLAKVDRASMAVSLETRLPLLDHRIVELAIRTPLPLKIAAGRGKRVLRRALARYLPQELIDRPKMGFSVPIGAWLRGPLRDWAEDLLSTATITRIGLFDVAATRRCWHEHASGRHDHYEKLWTVLQAHAWSTAIQRHA